MASSVFFGEKKLFALEVVFWQMFICTFLSADLRRHLIKSMACREQAGCGEEGESGFICQDNAADLAVVVLKLSASLDF